MVDTNISGGHNDSSEKTLETYSTESDSSLVQKQKYLDSKKISYSDENIADIFLGAIVSDLGYKEGTTYAYLVNQVFLHKRDFGKNIDHFLDTIGFIPDEIFQEDNFILRNNFSQVSRVSDHLRDAYHENKGRFSDVRAKYMNSIFRLVENKGKLKNNLKKRIEVKSSSVTLDKNGIQIKIVDIEEGGGSVNSHIPYHLMSQSCLDDLKAIGFIDDIIYTQINNTISGTKSNVGENIHLIRSSVIDVLEVNESGNEVLDIANSIIRDPKAAAEKLVKANINIDNEILEEIKNIAGKNATFVLLKFAEEMNLVISNKQVIEGLNSLDFKQEVLFNFSKRRATLDNNPLGKTIYTCINLALSQTNDQDILYKYTPNKRKEHVIVGVVNKHGSSRNLVNKDKLSGDIDTVSEINEVQYKNIEIFFQDYHLVMSQVHALGQDDIDETERRDILEGIIIFSLSYLSQHYSVIMNHVGEISNHISDEEIIKNFQEYFLEILTELGNNWQDITDQYSETKNVSDLLNVSSLTFNAEYIEKIKELGIPDSQYDLELTENGEQIKIVEIRLAQEDMVSGKHFQIHGLQEILAIKQLGLSDNKPLVVISGGCASTDEKDIENFYNFTKDKLIEGIEKGANIAVVGNQSTAGILASRAIAEIKSTNEEFSASSAGKIFAVATLGNIYYGQEGATEGSYEIPGNYDLIGIAMNPDWSVKGRELIDSNFLQFLEMANQFFNRLSSKHGRNHCISDGGLFSVIESIGTARVNNGCNITLNKNGGRFSSAAAYFIEHMQETQDARLFVELNRNTVFSSLENIQTGLEKLHGFLQENMPEYYQEWKDKDFGNLEHNGDVFDSLGGSNYSIGSIDTLFKDACIQAEENDNQDFQPKHFLYQLKFLEFISYLVSDSSKLEQTEIK